jgi:hypothetical protein
MALFTSFSRRLQAEPGSPYFTNFSTMIDIAAISILPRQARKMKHTEPVHGAFGRWVKLIGSKLTIEV